MSKSTESTAVPTTKMKKFLTLSAASSLIAISLLASGASAATTNKPTATQLIVSPSQLSHLGGVITLSSIVRSINPMACTFAVEPFVPNADATFRCIGGKVSHSLRLPANPTNANKTYTVSLTAVTYPYSYVVVSKRIVVLAAPSSSATPAPKFNWPTAIESSGGHVWVANSGRMYSGDSITELNASDGSLVRILSSRAYNFSGPSGIAVSGGKVWVANQSGNSVTEINASNGKLIRVVKTKSHWLNAPISIAASGNSVWVGIAYGAVTELNASNGSMVRVINRNLPGFWPVSLTISGPDLWVSNGGTSQHYGVSEYNVANGSLVHYFSSLVPQGVAMSGSDAWVLISDGGSGGGLTKINASSDAVILPYSSVTSFNAPSGITAGGNFLWIVNGDGSVVQLNSLDGSTVQVISGQANQTNHWHAISADATHIWETSFDPGTNGGSVVEINSSDGSVVQVIQ
jgi:hypothetical protein